MSKHSTFSDYKIQCPYYKYSKGLKIYCLNQKRVEFSDKKSMNYWLALNCQRYPNRCPVTIKIERSGELSEK